MDGRVHRLRERAGWRRSRVGQIVDRCGRDFDGIVILRRAMRCRMPQAVGANAVSRCDRSIGRGRLLQDALPDARIVNVPATGGITVQNLAYNQRASAFGRRRPAIRDGVEFIEAIEDGGVAAVEVMTHDRQALGLYMGRLLSYLSEDEYELFEHQLASEQICIVDACAEAFAVIHSNFVAAIRGATLRERSVY
ncbi:MULTISPECIES: strawberry notch-like NTP hydrolase domain-containing protein [unclassified Bradyrhizobium]|uniref:strawberry notch-like NTP hydrolase domain-containing protein n=1 Tax=unclassified Bradyrhizobium TaxID=2631580 RepID=UPI0028E592A7|nr:MULTISPECIES: strawberry notch family protein [unclassified Bradyrhizobium]